MSSPQNDLVLEAADVRFAHPGEGGAPGFELLVPRAEVRAGETLAVCGSSGSGKSTLLAALAGLLRPASGAVRHATPAGRIDPYGGSVRDWRRHRRHVGFVYQDPREYLNDRRTVVDIVADPLHVHGLFDRGERRERATEALRDVGLTRVQAERSPGALSGGQRQRVAVARAMITRPRLIFLDEPTSALDVSVQAAVVELLRRFHAGDRRAGFVLVTHELALARQLADRIIVLDGGRVVDSGPVEDVFGRPSSAVTRALLGRDEGR
jgi:ABC-type glutathione transport system ATPase component